MEHGLRAELADRIDTLIAIRSTAYVVSAANALSPGIALLTLPKIRPLSEQCRVIFTFAGHADCRSPGHFLLGRKGHADDVCDCAARHGDHEWENIMATIPKGLSKHSVAAWHDMTAAMEWRTAGSRSRSLSACGTLPVRVKSTF